jgi:hypothetical protein
MGPLVGRGVPGERERERERERQGQRQRVALFNKNGNSAIQKRWRIP